MISFLEMFTKHAYGFHYQESTTLSSLDLLSLFVMFNWLHALQFSVFWHFRIHAAIYCYGAYTDSPQLRTVGLKVF